MANFEVDAGCALSNSEGLQVLALAVAPDLRGLAKEHEHKNTLLRILAVTSCL